MICPKCNAEYRDGFSKCSDCGVDLVPKAGEIHRGAMISWQGIALVKLGLGLMFFCALEMIAVIIAYEYYWVYRLNNGGVTGSVIENVHPLVWVLCVVQVILSFIALGWGASMKETNM